MTRSALRASARVFFLGGLTSYRALFSWLSPWILIPTFLVQPVFQVLFFVYVGRSAQVGSDSFFLIGNAVQFAAIPCLFAMSNTIGGERNAQTLGLLLISPARRLPLFLGRALPVILNGFLVSIFTLVVGALVLQVRLPVTALLPLAAVLAVSSFACTGLGLVTAALALRVRETAVLANLMFGMLLIFSGANVSLTSLPAGLSAISTWIPLTHGIAAARELAAGATLDAVSGAIAKEAGIGLMYLVFGLVMLRVFELESRRHASLERS